MRANEPDTRRGSIARPELSGAYPLDGWRDDDSFAAWRRWPSPRHVPRTRSTRSGSLRTAAPCCESLHTASDERRQMLADQRLLRRDQVRRRALEHNLSALVTRAGAEVDDPVGVRHHRLVVLGWVPPSAVSAWLVGRMPLGVLAERVTGVELERHAEILESEPARWHWLHVRDRLAETDDVLAPLRELIEVLTARRIATTFYTYSSLNRLCFSASSHYPWVDEGLPVVAPTARHAGGCSIGDLSVLRRQRVFERACSRRSRSRRLQIHLEIAARSSSATLPSLLKLSISLLVSPRSWSMPTAGTVSVCIFLTIGRPNSLRATTNERRQVFTGQRRLRRH
jgi:hypothetical protein